MPCHRVVGKDNKLVDYGGGIENKIMLLKHEKTKKKKTLEYINSRSLVNTKRRHAGS